MPLKNEVAIALCFQPRCMSNSMRQSIQSLHKIQVISMIANEGSYIVLLQINYLVMHAF